MSVSKIFISPLGWGGHLKALRLGRRWSQEELASRCELTSARISQIESGQNDNVTLGALLSLQRAFGLDSVEALLGSIPSAESAGVAPWDVRG